MSAEYNPEFEAEYMKNTWSSRIKDEWVRGEGNELGLDPTVTSRTGWHLCHPRFDPSVTFEPFGKPFTLPNGYNLEIGSREDEHKGHDPDIRVYSEGGRIYFKVGNPIKDDRYVARRRSSGLVEATAVVYVNERLNMQVFARFRPAEYKERVFVYALRRLKDGVPETKSSDDQNQDQTVLRPDIEQFLREVQEGDIGPTN